MVDGRAREVPILRLPEVVPGAAPAAEVLARHFLAGSKKVRDEKTNEEHFVDKCENHYLLSAAYARLAETIGAGVVSAPFAYERVLRRADPFRSADESADEPAAYRGGILI